MAVLLVLNCELPAGTPVTSSIGSSSTNAKSLRMHAEGGGVKRELQNNMQELPTNATADKRR